MAFAQAAIVNCQSNTGVLADGEYSAKDQLCFNNTVIMKEKDRGCWMSSIGTKES